MRVKCVQAQSPPIGVRKLKEEMPAQVSSSSFDCSSELRGPSKKAGKVSKMTNALDVHRLPAPLKMTKRFLRLYNGNGGRLNLACLQRSFPIWQKCFLRRDTRFLIQPAIKESTDKVERNPPSQSPRKRKFHQDCSIEKVILEVFFDIQGIVHLESITEKRTVNKTKQKYICGHPVLFA
ncbi:hypothetical protein TNCV_1385061 [Trichonephila clavipes]|nr:hypothetical protein TNCV_1385061 [Trichonephila clavipes]